MLEADVTLTDFGLAIECGVFAWLVARRVSRLSRWFVLFFSSIGLAALTGGLVHGFFPAENSLPYAVLWRLTLLAIGLTGFSAWGIAAGIRFSGLAYRLITLGALCILSIYTVISLAISQQFIVAILHYLPPMLFLLVILALEQRAGRGGRGVIMGICGILLTFVASGVQIAGISLHPVYFDHNALYHVIQAGALALIFIWGKGSGAERLS
jgi:hypothetical protein